MQKKKEENRKHELKGLDSKAQKHQKQLTKEQRSRDDHDFECDCTADELTQLQVIKQLHVEAEYKYAFEHVCQEHNLALEQNKKLSSLQKEALNEIHQLELELLRSEHASGTSNLVSRQMLQQEHAAQEQKLISKQQQAQLQTEQRIKTKEYKDKQKDEQREWQLKLNKGLNKQQQKKEMDDRKKEMDKKDQDFFSEMKKQQQLQEEQLKKSQLEQMRALKDGFFKDQAEFKEQNANEEKALEKQHQDQIQAMLNDHQQKEADLMAANQQKQIELIDQQEKLVHKLLDEHYSEQQQLLQEQQKQRALNELNHEKGRDASEIQQQQLEKVAKEHDNRERTFEKTWNDWKEKVISNQQEELRKLYEQHIKDNPSQAAQRKAEKEKEKAEKEKEKAEKAKKKATKSVKKAPAIVVTDNGSSTGSDIVPVDKPKKDDKKLAKDNSKDLKDLIKKPKKDKMELLPKEDKSKEDLKRTAAPRVTTRTRHTRSPSYVEEFNVEEFSKPAEEKTGTTPARGHSRTISESNVMGLVQKKSRRSTRST